MLKFHCSCGKKIGVPDDWAGRRVRCPQCQASVIAQPEGPPAGDAGYAGDAGSAGYAGYGGPPAAYSPPPVQPAPAAYAQPPQAYAQPPQAYAQPPQAYAHPSQAYAPYNPYPPYGPPAMAQPMAAAPPMPGPYAPPGRTFAPARPPRGDFGGVPAWVWGLIGVTVVIIAGVGWIVARPSPAPVAQATASTTATTARQTTPAAPATPTGKSPGLQSTVGVPPRTVDVLPVRPSPVAPKPADPPVTAAGPMSADQLFAAASPAVAKIWVSNGSGEVMGQGSGFLVSADGVLVTNYHVIRGARSASAEFRGEGRYDVEGVLAVDVDQDLAVLKLAVRDMPYLRLSVAPPRVGAKVFAIGSPRGFTNTLSEGLVSGLRDDKEREGSGAIQTTAAISPGSSGGPLMTADGRVIGVITETMRWGQNLNFAVTAAAADALVRKGGAVQTFAAIEASVARGDDAKWTAAGTPIQSGDFEVRIAAARIAPAALVPPAGGRDVVTSERYLQIEIRLVNRNTGKAHPYSSWGRLTVGEDGGPGVTEIIDDRGTSYQRSEFGSAGKLRGRIDAATVAPGGTITDVLAFEPPAAKAKFVRIELPAENFGGRGVLRFQIDRAAIVTR